MDEIFIQGLSPHRTGKRCKKETNKQTYKQTKKNKKRETQTCKQLDDEVSGGDNMSTEEKSENVR